MKKKMLWIAGVCSVLGISMMLVSICFGGMVELSELLLESDWIKMVQCFK